MLCSVHKYCVLNNKILKIKYESLLDTSAHDQCQESNPRSFDGGPDALSLHSPTACSNDVSLNHLTSLL